MLDIKESYVKAMYLVGHDQATVEQSLEDFEYSFTYTNEWEILSALMIFLAAQNQEMSYGTDEIKIEPDVLNVLRNNGYLDVETRFTKNHKHYFWKLTRIGFSHLALKLSWLFANLFGLNCDGGNLLSVSVSGSGTLWRDGYYKMMLFEEGQQKTIDTNLQFAKQNLRAAMDELNYWQMVKDNIK